MALIYKLKIPEDIFTSGRFEQTFGTVGNSTTTYKGTDDREYYTTSLRTQPAITSLYTIPKEDVSSRDFKVSTRLNENKSKITYTFSLVGPTAKMIIDYLRYARFPGFGITEAYHKPIEGLEYLYNLDKQIGITILDDCCPADGKKTKTVLEGYIPLNSVKYCLDGGCSVTCTIYEDTERVRAMACIESTVLGTRSNSGILRAAEGFNDKLHEEQFSDVTSTLFAGVNAKWFDACVEPESTGVAEFLLSLVGFLKLILIPPIFVILGVVIIITTVINIIIKGINLIPGVNIDIIDFALFTGVDFIGQIEQSVDIFFGTERMAEGVLGCKYIRGGFRVASIIKAACSICGFSSESLRSLTTEGFEDNSLIVTTPVSYNPFVPFGYIHQQINPILQDGFNTAYIPAEEAYTRRKEKNLIKDYLGANNPTEFFNSLSDIAVRASSIETTDKVFDRLGTLWGTTWQVVSTPETNLTPTKIQLMLGPLEGRYIFDKSELVTIKDASICYEAGDGQPIGFETNFTSDSNDKAGNRQLRGYKGYISYLNTDFIDRKPKEIKSYDVAFSPVHFVDSLRNDTLYDEYSGKTRNSGLYNPFKTFFEGGLMVNGSVFTTVPKLVTFYIASTNVLDNRKACRVKEDNNLWLGSRRMSDYVDTFVANSAGDNALIFTPSKPAALPTGLQNLIPYYSIGYFGKNKSISSTIEDSKISLLANDLDNKFSSENFGYSEALENIRQGKRSYTGPFNNYITGNEIPADSQSYNFAPLMEFTLEKENYICGDDDLMNECITSAVVKKANRDLYETDNPNYKLRLLKLSQGLGVVTSLEIDYENRSIKAEGYVIPFFQRGVDYSSI